MWKKRKNEKKTTLKEHILNYAANNRYFNINDLRNYFNDKKIDYKDDTLKKYLYLLKNEYAIYGAGRGWYSTIKPDFVLDTTPVEEIRTLILDKFPLLDFSCWGTEQIKGFFHHVPSQFVTLVYADKDFLQALKDFRSDNGYNRYQNPRKSEAERHVDLKTRTVVLRPSISPRVPKDRVWQE